MEFPNGDSDKITGYHAHIYYDAKTRAQAARLRWRIWDKWGFEVTMGRFRDRPVGPHPEWMFQVAFDKPLFPEVVPWLMYNRDGLTVLVHPEAEDAYLDHAFYPLWMGAKLDLNVEWLKEGRTEA